MPRTVDCILALDEFWAVIRTRMSDPLTWTEDLFCRLSEVSNYFTTATASLTS